MITKKLHFKNIFSKVILKNMIIIISPPKNVEKCFSCEVSLKKATRDKDLFTKSIFEVVTIVINVVIGGLS